MVVKNPDSRKNKGMRKPCTAWKNSSYKPSWSTLESCTAQKAGKNASDACSAIPNNIAKPRSASRSWRRRPLDDTASAAAEAVAFAVTL